jgi:hypothetical protein
MSCIFSVSFVVLRNGTTTPFFLSSKDLRQRCLLSPILFLLIVEGLSRLLKEAKGNGSIKWVLIGVSCNITHPLFVNDILILCKGTKRVIENSKGIMDLFNKATRTVINMEKSIMTLWGISKQEKIFITRLFPDKILALE